LGEEENTILLSNTTCLEEEVRTHKRTIEEITARKLYYKQWAQKNDNALQQGSKEKPGGDQTEGPEKGKGHAIHANCSS
jgi:hypothetical protein